MLAGYRNLLVHEITHLVQANAYVLGGSGEKTIWEIEGGATLAEQLVAYDLFGHGSGRNLGHAQVHQSEESRAWYWGGWIADMVSFFGWDGFGAGSGRVRGAPEECTWIGTEEDGNTGPCAGGQVYGVPSMLLRFVMDRWGEEYPGGEAALMRRFVNSPSSGFSSLEEVSGREIEQILAEFYIALWGDGRPVVPRVRLGLDGFLGPPRHLQPLSRRLPAAAAKLIVPKPAGRRQHPWRIQPLRALVPEWESGANQHQGDRSIRCLGARTRLGLGMEDPMRAQSANLIVPGCTLLHHYPAFG